MKRITILTRNTNHISKSKFSTKSTSQIFHEIYRSELEKLNKQNQLLVEANYKVKEDTTPTQSYVHPYHTSEFPIFWSTNNMVNTVVEARGPEPVSPHYESFALSRRFPLIAAACLVIMGKLEDLNPGSFYGKSATFNTYTVMLLGVGISESRYLLMKVPTPKLTWFYDAFHTHEFRQMIQSWGDSLDEVIRIGTAESKEQIDYYNIHKEFVYVKKRVLTSFLENEKIALNENYKQRALSLLSTVENLENSNIKKKLTQETEQALNIVLNKIKDPKMNKEIIDASFESALKGLAQGEMKYEGDKLLPMLVEELNNRISPLKNLSQEEENKLFSINDDQKKYLVASDNKAKTDYLNKHPDLNTSIKNSEVYSEIVKRMKNRVESSIKV
jgi:hypothetical protein